MPNLEEYEEDLDDLDRDLDRLRLLEEYERDRDRDLESFLESWVERRLRLRWCRRLLFLEIIKKGLNFKLRAVCLC